MHTPKKNTGAIFVDGVEFAAPEEDFGQTGSQRHIVPVNSWLEGETIEAKKEIKVVFEDNDAGGSQAANFNGILISG